MLTLKRLLLCFHRENKGFTPQTVEKSLNSAEQFSLSLFKNQLVVLKNFETVFLCDLTNTFFMNLKLL